MKESPAKRTLPSPLISLIPILILVILLSFVIYNFGSDSLTGASQVILLTVSAIVVAIGIVVYKIPFSEFDKAIADKIYGVAQAIILLLLIGSLSGSWMISGVVPTMIYYGVQIVTPQIFLAAGCVICAIVSVLTGSSWTTVATIGIALMGIGNALGFDPAWSAGAIISGSYFGDKISPLSDTTVLASGSTGTPLFTHIRYMFITTIPSLTIALIVFLAAGFMQDTTDSVMIHHYTTGLRSAFHITPWLFLVPLFTVVLIVKQWPSLAVLFMSTLAGTVAAMIAQPDVLDSIGSSVGDGMLHFKGVMRMLFGSTRIDTGDAMLNELVATRGMGGMMNTIWLILCAMVFGGVMTASGMLDSIMQFCLRLAHRTVGYVTSTVVVGLILNATTSDQYLAIILTSNMFKDAYRKKGLEPRLLSRTVEDSVTVTSVLVPWNTCAMTQSAVLNISTFAYFPYCIFNIVSPIMTILIAAIGYKIKLLKPIETTEAEPTTEEPA
jgi:NhaC family Na+:H+ antiporter